MKKLLNIKIIGLIVIGMIVSFFLFKSNKADNLKLIPSDASLVISADIFSIFRKGELSELEDLKMFKSFKKEVKNENRKMSKILDDIIEDPRELGVSFKSDFFYYIIGDIEDYKSEAYYCFSFDLSNEKKFSALVENLLDDLDIDYDKEEEDDFSYILIEEDDCVIGWDKEKGVIISPNYGGRENLDDQIEDLFSIKKKDQITENKAFNKFLKSKKDISLYVSGEMWENLDGFDEIEELMDIDLQDNSMAFHLNFNDDNISLLTEFSPNKDLKELMEKHDIFDNTFNSKLLKVLPEQSYACASISINPMEYFEFAKEEMNDFEDMEEEINDELEELGFKLEEIVKTTNGNAIISLFGFEKMEYTYLGWGYGFDSSEGELQEEQYLIDAAGYLSYEEKEALNDGKTIKSNAYPSYCININNILEEGGDVESAIRDNQGINWYKGGWTYGRHVETTKEELLPLIGFAFDINNKENVEDFIENFNKIAEENDGHEWLKQRKNYYEFLFDDKYPTFLSFNEEVLFITNDEKRIQAFSKDEFANKNLKDSDIASEILDNSSFGFINLDYDEYPKDLKKEVKENQSRDDKKAFEMVTEFVKSMEVKIETNTSAEAVLTLKESKGNSLHNIINFIDKNYRYLTSL